MPLETTYINVSAKKYRDKKKWIEEKKGRGLRICVNQDGERVYGFDVNTLTIMANETYEEFAIGLQREIEKKEAIVTGKQIGRAHV